MTAEKYTIRNSYAKEDLDCSGLAYVTSLGRGGGQKHWFLKSDSSSKDTALFLELGLMDSVCSRVAAQALKGPKGKFVSPCRYVSRIDDRSPRNPDGSIKNPNKLNLHNLLDVGEDGICPIYKATRLVNFVESLVLAIIFGDDDTKLQNFTAIPIAERPGEYIVAPFDFEYALHSNSLLSPGVWTEEKLRNLVYGLHNNNSGEEIGVAMALVHAVANFGDTSTPYYRQEPDVCTYYNRFEEQIGWLVQNELDLIGENHTFALLSVFENILGRIPEQIRIAHQKTMTDCLTKFPEASPQILGLYKTLDVISGGLLRSAEHFSSCIRSICEEIRERTVEFESPPFCSGSGDGSALGAVSSGLIAARHKMPGFRDLLARQRMQNLDLAGLDAGRRVRF